MNLTKQDELLLNLLSDACSEKIGGVDYLIGSTEELDAEHHHSAIQIQTALRRARVELDEARTLARNVVNFYYGRIVAEAKEVAKAEPGRGPTTFADNRKPLYSQEVKDDGVSNS